MIRLPTRINGRVLRRVRHPARFTTTEALSARKGGVEFSRRDGEGMTVSFCVVTALGLGMSHCEEGVDQHEGWDVFPLEEVWLSSLRD